MVEAEESNRSRSWL